MKKMTCEMCGGNDLLKQEGVFVCQSCGTKYSVEEAKKMMVEGTVEVAGTVKVDSSDELNNLYQLARRAKKEENSEKAIKYYEMISLKDSNSWEAAFYSAYYSASKEYKNEKIGAASDLLHDCIDSVFNLIRDNIQDANEQKKAAMEVAKKIDELCEALYIIAKETYKSIAFMPADSGREIKDAGKANDRRVLGISKVYDLLGDKISELFGNDDDLCDVAVSSWKKASNAIGVIKFLMGSSEKYNNYNIIDKKIKKYDEPWYWKQYGYCRYCGGEVGGLFTKKCKSCGKPQ